LQIRYTDLLVCKCVLIRPNCTRLCTEWTRKNWTTLERLLKRAAMVFRYAIGMLSSCWPTGVHKQHWLCILRGLCAIIKPYAEINWHFQHSLFFFSKFMQRIFKYGYIQNITVAPDKEVNILMYGTPSSNLIIYKSCKILKWSSFWLTMYSWNLENR